MTLVEVAVFAGIFVPAMVALLSVLGTFSASTAAAHHRTNVNANCQKVLQRIASELSQTSTKVDHAVPATQTRPQAEHDFQGVENRWYDYAPTLGTHTCDWVHNTMERDGSEDWHPSLPTRRMYIYRTYEPFDTIEFQKIQTTDMSNVNVASGTVNQPWSPRRKIFLQGGEVILRVDKGGGDVESVVLGREVSALRFHLNADGHIVIRIVTWSGTAGSSTSGAALAAQVAVNPMNPLN
jgi:hypothetical protein